MSYLITGPGVKMAKLPHCGPYRPCILDLALMMADSGREWMKDGLFINLFIFFISQSAPEDAIMRLSGSVTTWLLALSVTYFLQTSIKNCD